MAHIHEAATPCASIPAGLPCQSYRFGHHVHFIHGNRLGETPWGWRDAVVTALAAKGWIDVAYVAEESAAHLWHHRDLTGEIGVGAPVRVHERYPALSGAFGIVNVSIIGGLGPVPEPEHPQTWAQKMSVGVVDLSSGRGVDLGAVDAEDRP